MALIGLILFGLITDLGGNPHHDRIGFRYWHDPGPFSEYLKEGALGRFLGVWAVLINAVSVTNTAGCASSLTETAAVRIYGH